MDTIVYDAVQDVKAVAEYNGGGIEALLGKGVVKSVQRGTGFSFQTQSDTDYGYGTVTISNVDVSKTILIYDGYTVSTQGHDLQVTAKLNSGSISITTMSGAWMGTLNFSSQSWNWQVIEFY